MPVCPKCGKEWIVIVTGPDVEPGQMYVPAIAVYRDVPACRCGISLERTKTFHMETP